MDDREHPTRHDHDTSEFRHARARERNVATFSTVRFKPATVVSCVMPAL
jgi:hypothetical protein